MMDILIKEVHIGKEQIRVCLHNDALDNAHIALYMKFHWMLAVINPWNNIVYWLDPIRKGVPDNFRAMVDTISSNHPHLMRSILLMRFVKNGYSTWRSKEQSRY